MASFSRLCQRKYCWTPGDKWLPVWTVRVTPQSGRSFWTSSNIKDTAVSERLDFSFCFIVYFFLEYLYHAIFAITVLWRLEKLSWRLKELFILCRKIHLFYRHSYICQNTSPMTDVSCFLAHDLTLTYQTLIPDLTLIFLHSHATPIWYPDCIPRCISAHIKMFLYYVPEFKLYNTIAGGCVG